MVETWSRVCLPFVFCYFKETLIPKSKGFNHWTCEGVVSLSLTLWFWLPSNNLYSTSVISGCMLRSALSQGNESIGSVPHLNNNKKKKKEGEKRQKKLLHSEVLKVLSLARIPEMKSVLNAVFSKGLFYPCWIWICSQTLK